MRKKVGLPKLCFSPLRSRLSRFPFLSGRWRLRNLRGREGDTRIESANSRLLFHDDDGSSPCLLPLLPPCSGDQFPRQPTKTRPRLLPVAPLKRSSAAHSRRCKAMNWAQKKNNSAKIFLPCLQGLTSSEAFFLVQACLVVHKSGERSVRR